MFKIKQTLKQAIQAKDHQTIRALVCLIPELANDDLKDYLSALMVEATPEHIETFSSLWVYGQHYWDKSDFLGSENDAKDSLASSSPSEDSKADFKPILERASNQKLSESNALKLKLPQEVYQELCQMLFILVGQKPTFSESSFRRLEQKTIRGPHLRFICKPEETAPLKAALDLFSIPYYVDFYKSSQKQGEEIKNPVVTISQNAIKQIYALFERPHFAKSSPFQMVLPEANGRDEVAELWFDCLFNADLLLLRLGMRARGLFERAPTDKPQSLNSDQESPLEQWLDGLRGYLNSKIEEQALTLVPWGIEPLLPDNNVQEKFRRMAFKSHIPWVVAKEELSASPDEQPLSHFPFKGSNKWRLLELAFFSNQVIDRFKQTAVNKYPDPKTRSAVLKQVEAFCEYYQNVLSTYVCQSIRSKHEVTAAQPLSWSLGEYADSQSSQKEGSLSLDDKIYKQSKLKH